MLRVGGCRAAAWGAAQGGRIFFIPTLKELNSSERMAHGDRWTRRESSVQHWAALGLGGLGDQENPTPWLRKGGLQAWCGPAPSILSGWGRPAGLLSWSVKGAHLSLTDQNLHVDVSVNGSSLHNMSVMLSERERAR